MVLYCFFFKQSWYFKMFRTQIRLNFFIIFLNTRYEDFDRWRTIANIISYSVHINFIAPGFINQIRAIKTKLQNCAISSNRKKKNNTASAERISTGGQLSISTIEHPHRRKLTLTGYIGGPHIQWRLSPKHVVFHGPVCLVVFTNAHSQRLQPTINFLSVVQLRRTRSLQLSWCGYVAEPTSHSI